MQINDTLNQRSNTHGDFLTNSQISQGLKTIYKNSPNHDNNMSAYQQEALDMIVHKIARIVCGNPNEPDHWHDIAGYATLVYNQLQK